MHNIIKMISCFPRPLFYALSKRQNKRLKNEMDLNTTFETPKIPRVNKMVMTDAPDDVSDS